MMVQLANPARLNQLMKLGAMVDVYNTAGVPIPAFKAVRTTWCSAWSRTQMQQFTAASVGMQDTVVYVIRSGVDYAGVTRVQVGGHNYQLVDKQIEPVPGPSAYDLLTLREVTKRG